MKPHFTGLSIILTAALIVVIFFTGCKKKVDQASLEPTATTGTAAIVGQKWATLIGYVNASNQICEVSFEYDTATSFRYNIRATTDTITGNTTSTVDATITGLKVNTTYYYRIKAICSSLTYYGKEATFTTTNPGNSIISYNPEKTYGSVMDFDSNVYRTILIGSQTWMAENLRARSYNNGTVIPFVPVESAWSDLSTPGYCWYNNDSVSYGAIYNWYAASNNNLCPTGWHVPSDTEWIALSTFLGGDSIAGGKLKETGTNHWLTTNNSSTNLTGFTALPGGYRSDGGTFSNIRRYGYWWSSTESSSINAFCRYMFYSFNNMNKSDSNRKSGFSVRCVKD